MTAFHRFFPGAPSIYLALQGQVHVDNPTHPQVGMLSTKSTQDPFSGKKLPETTISMWKNIFHIVIWLFCSTPLFSKTIKKSSCVLFILNAMHQGRSASKWYRVLPLHHVFPPCFGDSRATPSSLAYWLGSKKTQQTWNSYEIHQYIPYITIAMYIYIHTSTSITSISQKPMFLFKVKIHQFFLPWYWSKPGRKANTTVTRSTLDWQSSLFFFWGGIDTASPSEDMLKETIAIPSARSFTKSNLILLVYRMNYPHWLGISILNKPKTA